MSRRLGTKKPLSIVTLVATVLVALLGAIYFGGYGGSIALAATDIYAADVSGKDKFYTGDAVRVAADGDYVVTGLQPDATGAAMLHCFAGGVQYDFVLQASTPIKNGYLLHIDNGHILIADRTRIISININCLISGDAYSVTELELGGVFAAYPEWSAFYHSTLFVLEQVTVPGSGLGYKINTFELSYDEDTPEIAQTYSELVNMQPANAGKVSIAALDAHTLLIAEGNTISIADILANTVYENAYTLSSAYNISRISAHGSNIAVLSTQSGNSLLSFQTDGQSIFGSVSLELLKGAVGQSPVASQEIYFADDIYLGGNGLYVLDRDMGKVVKLDAETLSFCIFFGSYSSDDGDFYLPANVSWSTALNGAVVCDAGNNRLQILSQQPQSLFIDNPQAAASDGSGGIYAVSDGKLYYFGLQDGNYGQAQYADLDDVAAIKEGGGAVYAISQGNLYSLDSGRAEIKGDLPSGTFNFYPAGRTGGFYLLIGDESGYSIAATDKDVNILKQTGVYSGRAWDLFCDFGGNAYLLIGQDGGIAVSRIAAQQLLPGNADYTEIYTVNTGYTPDAEGQNCSFSVSPDGEVFLCVDTLHAVYRICRDSFNIITENVMPTLDYCCDPLLIDDASAYRYVTINGYPSTLFYPFLKSVAQPGNYPLSSLIEYRYDEVVRLSAGIELFSPGRTEDYILVFYNGEPGFILNDNATCLPAMTAVPPRQIKLLFDIELYRYPQSGILGGTIAQLKAGITAEVTGQTENADTVYYRVDIAVEDGVITGYISEGAHMPLLPQPQMPYIDAVTTIAQQPLLSAPYQDAKELLNIEGGSYIRIYYYTEEFAFVGINSGSYFVQGYIPLSAIAEDDSEKRQNTGLIIAGCAIAAGVLFAVIRRKFL